MDTAPIQIDSSPNVNRINYKGSMNTHGVRVTVQEQSFILNNTPFKFDSSPGVNRINCKGSMNTHGIKEIAQEKCFILNNTPIQLDSCNTISQVVNKTINKDESKLKKKVVNLSSQVLEPEVINVLRKGLGFAVTPKNLPFENMICNIEDGINNLPLEDKEALRQECSLIMRKAKTPKSNLSKAEQKAFKSLRNNEKIVVLKADKGGAAVILDKEDYIFKMNEHLNCGSYKKLNKNPIPKIMKEVKKAISESSIDDKLKKKLIPSSQCIPRIYGLPKIHKDGVPLRPIVNTIGSPTYELAKYVAKVLKPLVGNTDSFIKDSHDFVNLIKKEKLERDDILVSFDVVSLFTNIPLEEAIQVIKEVTDPGTARLAEICLRSTVFTFQGTYYEQTSGVAMGSPLSPIMANLYMEYFEKKDLESYPLKPAWWKRFVNDTNIKWTHGKAEL